MTYISSCLHVHILLNVFLTQEHLVLFHLSVKYTDLVRYHDGIQKLVFSYLF